MRKLKIETFTLDTDEKKEAITLPLMIIKSVLTFLPKGILERLKNDDTLLETLMTAIDDSHYSGMIIEAEDSAENERVILSIIS
ncbi:hypothetical protein [Enterovibrio nigricans]|uniref:Uncharacterized protein n=1 Tax=Enterovibrio nigricans DSM 22720 TaxID=1121868 RepID=A0A1T4VKX5_9GAMM|nr:hypothetical protein [Enterovibrio nigricans]SKA65231.1 hypothetical protein SAMN02745132_03940 [Enterovibrio nigricans DSM 22720]